jgi:membrane protease YdiL (CAAX protease family)
VQIAKKIFVCFLIVGVSVFGFILLVDVCVQIFANSGLEVAETGAGLTETVRKYFWIVFLQTAIWAPIMEELIFRFAVIELCFLLFKFVKNNRTKEVLIIIISAFIFMLWHRSWSQTIYQFIMGVVFAVIYIKTPNNIHRAFNLTWTMLIHFINNTFLIAYTYFVGDGDGEFVLNFFNVAVAVVLAVFAVTVIRDLLKLFQYKQRGTADRQGENKLKGNTNGAE